MAANEQDNNEQGNAASTETTDDPTVTSLEEVSVEETPSSETSSSGTPTEVRVSEEQPTAGDADALETPTVDAAAQASAVSDEPADPEAPDSADLSADLEMPIVDAAAQASAVSDEPADPEAPAESTLAAESSAAETMADPTPQTTDAPVASADEASGSPVTDEPCETPVDEPPVDEASASEKPVNASSERSADTGEETTDPQSTASEEKPVDDSADAPSARSGDTDEETAHQQTMDAQSSPTKKEQTEEPLDAPADRSEAESADEPELLDPFAVPADPLALIFQAPDLSAIPPAPAKRTDREDEDLDDPGSGEAESRDDRDDDEPDSEGRPSGSRRSRRRRSRSRSGGAAADRGTADHGARGDASGNRNGDDDGDEAAARSEDRSDDSSEDQSGTEGNGDDPGSRRRRRRRRGDVDMELAGGADDDPENTVTRVRAPRQSASTGPQAVTGLKGSTRLEAKRQRRRDSRTGGRQRRHVITEAEFLARRESVDRKMLVRQREHRIQIAVMEDGVLAEHFVSNTTQDSMIGNVYLGKVQNVLPSMEAAFVDIGRGRNAVLYAGEVNWDAASLAGKARKIENALKSGDSVLVQVTKDPVGHKGARLTSQISLPGRYLVYVPGGSMTGISRKLPDVERSRLKKILKDHVPESAGVIVRTAAEGTSEQELMNDINRLRAQWEGIEEKSRSTKVLAPELLYSEPDLTIKVVRDVFNEDFSGMVVQGPDVWDNIEAYVTYVAPHLLDRVSQWKPEDHEGEDLFASNRIDEQLHKALERKVFLPSGGSLVIDRTEAMTVVDVNTGKFTGSGGNLEETVTKNNLEAAEEIVRQLRLRDIGGIIVIDFIDMVLESNRDLVLRRMVECLGRDRTKHQVAEVTSLGLVQMTRKRMGTGLVEIFSETCEHCNGRGIVLHDMPVEHRRAHNSHGEPRSGSAEADDVGARKSSRSERRRRSRERQAERERESQQDAPAERQLTAEQEAERKARADAARAAFANIAAATQHAHDPAEVAVAAEHAATASAAAFDAAAGQASGNDDGHAPAGAQDTSQRGRSGAQSAADGTTPPNTGDVRADADDRSASEAGGRSGAGAAAVTSAESDAVTTTASGSGQTQESDQGGAGRSRRRRSRRAGSDQGQPSQDRSRDGQARAQNPSRDEDGQAQGQSPDRDAPDVEAAAPTLNIDGITVEIPRGDRAPRPTESQKDLSSLEYALDRRAPRSASDQAEGRAGQSTGTAPTSAEGAAEPVPAPARRRRRAASSDGTSGEIQTVELSADSSDSADRHRFSASAADIPEAGASASEASTVDPGDTQDRGSAGTGDNGSSAQAPMIIGVGVKAEDIARTE